jgi:tight adherence protein B
MKIVVRRLAAIGFVALLLLLGTLAGAGAATNDASIDHSESTNGTLRMLVSVPGTAAVDLSSVKVTIDGAAVQASAAAAASSSVVARTAVLAIDTSDSMHGAKIAAAKSAALNFLAAVPANVAIGIVTFDNSVHVLQRPSLDRAASQAVVNGLTLKLNTALYAGVREAVAATGSAGERQVLVLSDGQDNTGSPLDPVVAAIRSSGVKVDAVALEQGAAAPSALAAMAAAGRGTVVSASSAALAKAFSSAADALARQVVITAKVPAGQNSTDASVTVSLTSGGTQHDVSAYIQVRSAAQPVVSGSVPEPVASAPLSIPTPVMYGAVAAIGLGAIGVLVVMLGTTSPEKRASLAQQLQVYSATEDGSRRTRDQMRADHVQASSLAAQAKQAAQSVLATNSGFEAKIAGRLEGAGMALKSSEWLLLHVGIAFGAGLVGLLITAGNPVGLVLFLIIGAIGPWVYLGTKRSKRLKAFDAGLADTLQLMAGSLSAGLSLAQSMDTIVREGAEPITSEFKRVIVEARLGVGIEDALDGVAIRMQSTDFKWVVMAIRIQREVGGNLSELLLNVANTLREREYIRRHVRALSAEGRLSCWILGSLPPGFLVYLTLTKPTYVRPMYTSPIGWMMCGAMVVLLSVGMFWMTKVAKVEV